MKVQKRPETFDAIQVDLSPEGIIALQCFLRGPVHTTHERGAAGPMLALDGGKVVCPGDWLVRERLSDLRTLSPEAFATYFMPAETP